MKKFFLFLFLAGCASIPFDPCTVPTATRCADDVVQRCEGGYWYPELDCRFAGGSCKDAECKNADAK